MNPDCFALLDDAAAGGRSRLLTDHVRTLRCASFDTWPALLADMEAALAQGYYAVVLCSYELGHHIVGIPPRDAGVPLARVLLFRDCAHLDGEAVARWLAERAGDGVAGLADIGPNVTETQFTQAIGQIREYIAAGDTYQVNYTYRLRFDAFGAPCALYQRLRARQPVPYGALVLADDGTATLSLSPELFVRRDGDMLTAQPMKGTAPAALPGQVEDIDAENARRAAALAADPKNRAENLMIVDLLRNDIGRVAVTGSVKVPALFEVRRYSGVLQMTSTVQARVRPDATLADLFTALYPCGSITGAPKRRTMEIIAELEPAPRGLYTGAIGWFDPPRPGAPGDFCLNVPIRTLSLQAEANGVRQGEMGVGAGIVYDSVAADEYAECRLKARFLTGLSNDFELFETMYATREQGARHVERHLARLARSARYFGFQWDEAAARAYIGMACEGLPDGEQMSTPHRLRLAMNAAGGFAVQTGVLAPLQQPVRVLLAGTPTASTDLFLRHKTTLRSDYDAAWKAAEAQGAFDQLHFNERGELTEGGRSSVFVRIGGRWLTPALACGLLPGVMRAVVLEAWAAAEAVITREMLAGAEEIVVCNALRGALRATL
ncbi:aminodeoxychorismate synthase component I [Massilia sp. METH4]|uniref:aminodeoxychorismate synthase component I n=1 Tax=Massilia sp. METH4 TaxID=3123041 RepID=UPI0030D50E11